jgi:hypothetical protein
MAIANFSDDTFVAFMDISGFKDKVKENTAANALNVFYNAGYEALDTQLDISGFFVSDCAILFVNQPRTKSEQLEHLLRVIKAINRSVLEDGIMLTTSIAYGNFSYQNRLELPNISKGHIISSAYIEAFLDNEQGNPKMIAGQCRILKSAISQEEITESSELSLLEFNASKKHISYYWNLERPDQIDQFKRDYKEAKYQGMLNTLKHRY